MKQSAVNKILASSPEPHIDGIIVINKKGVIQAFDEAAQLLFGYTHDEAIGQPLTMLMPTAQAKEHPSYLAQAEKKESHRTHKLNTERTIIGKHKQGYSIPLAITVSADNSSPDMRFTGVLQDLRKHENQLTQIFQDFESTTKALNQRIEFDALLNDCSNQLLSCHPENLSRLWKSLYRALENFYRSITVSF